MFSYTYVEAKNGNTLRTDSFIKQSDITKYILQRMLELSRQLNIIKYNYKEDFGVIVDTDNNIYTFRSIPGGM